MPRHKRPEDQPGAWIPGRVSTRTTGTRSRGNGASSLETESVRSQNTPFPPKPPVTASHLPPGWRPGQPLPEESRAWAQYERLLS